MQQNNHQTHTQSIDRFVHPQQNLQSHAMKSKTSAHQGGRLTEKKENRSKRKIIIKLIRKLLKKTPANYLLQAKKLIKNNQQSQAKRKLWRSTLFFPENTMCTETLLKLMKADEEPRQILRLSNIILSHNPGSTNGWRSKTLSLLILGKKTKLSRTIKRYFASQSHPHTRFFNGLSNFKINPRKLLWVSSFHTFQNPHTHDHSLTNTQPFQYWSQDLIPPDIQSLQKEWNALLNKANLPKIILFNKKSARSWIKSHTPELLRHFDNAPLFAMEADIFRIAYAVKNDCIWIDSDEFPRTATSQILQHWIKRCDTLFLFRWNRPWISNSFFMTRKSSPFFLELEQSIQSYQLPTGVISRKDVLNSYGPGRYNKQLNKLIRERNFLNDSNPIEAEKALIKLNGWRYGFTNEKIFCSLKPPFKLNYENTTDSWHRSVDGLNQSA